MRVPAVIGENLRLLGNLSSGGIFNAAGLGFAAYVILICYPGIRATSAQLMDVRSGYISVADVSEISLLTAVPSLLIGLLIFARHGVVSVVQRAQPLIIFVLIFSSLVIFMSVLGAEYIGSAAQIIQYAATVGCFMLCLCFWQAPARDVDNALAMAFLALASCLIVAAVVQGFHAYRWVGLIHPNHYARYAYIALILHSLAVKRVSLLVFIPCFAAIWIVSARTVMIGALVFYLGYLAVEYRQTISSRSRQLITARTIAVGMIVAPFAVLVALLYVDTDRLIEKITDNLAIFDPLRGFGSGFTGRSESWNVFFNDADKFIFFGYGFRSSRYLLHSVHSGILSYFMDFGLILGGILLCAVLSRGVYILWYGLTRPDRGSLLIGLGITTTLIIQLFEPDNFNIGFIGAFFFMLMLAFSPRAPQALNENLFRADPTSHKLGLRQ